MNYSLFSSESVCAGHPDKVCDQISDAIVDAAIKANPYSRVACETLVTTNQLILAGEISCPKKIDYQKIARQVITDLGYTQDIFNFGPQTKITTHIHHQSADIALGVDNGGAGDQGMMFGYATNETPQLLPLPISLSHQLARSLDELAQSKLDYLRPDGKSQVTIQYNRQNKPSQVTNVVLAKPHDPRVSQEEAKEDLYRLAVLPLLKQFRLPAISKDSLIFNGTGTWQIGGPASDTGVTGRKIAVDTYGGMGRIGGGCFSGKDPTKVDRSAAYAARFIAKNIIANKLADRCEVQLAYAIGQHQPVCKAIETFASAHKSQKFIEDFAWKLLDLSVEGIIQGLNLRQPIYQPTARYGHFGDPQYSWEQLV